MTKKRRAPEVLKPERDTGIGMRVARCVGLCRAIRDSRHDDKIADGTEDVYRVRIAAVGIG